MSETKAPALNIDASLPALAGALRSGQLAVARYLAMLEFRFERLEPWVRAFMPEPDRFSRLRDEAAALEARWPAPAERPPLFGVPVGVKDIMRVDGLPTTGGSQLPVEVLAGPESDCVTRLKQAGTLILGKTVSTEFAYFEPGPTRNPRDPAHTPGGSSSGSAAAVAAALCPLALGTQTIGSIIRPAAFCGVVGFKPSFGRISADSVIPLAPSLDHVGLFTSNVAGAALAASVMLGDWQPAPAAHRPVLGVPDGPYLQHASAEALAHFETTLAQLERQGFTVVRVPAMLDFEQVRQRHNLIVAAEAAAVHADWFDRYRERYRPRTVDLIERGRAVSSSQLAEALAGREALRAELTGLMQAHTLDLWVAPAAPGPAPAGLGATGDPVMNLPWTHSGLPALSLPAGAAEGLPLGLQVAGRWRADEQLLAWGAALETALAQQPVEAGRS